MENRLQDGTGCAGFPSPCLCIKSAPQYVCAFSYTLCRIPLWFNSGICGQFSQNQSITLLPAKPLRLSYAVCRWHRGSGLGGTVSLCSDRLAGCMNFLQFPFIFFFFPMKKKQKIPAVQSISTTAAARCAKSSELTPWNKSHGRLLYVKGRHCTTVSGQLKTLEFHGPQTADDF